MDSVFAMTASDAGEPVQIFLDQGSQFPQPPLPDPKGGLDFLLA
jgi:hypothetical protein